MQRLVTQKVLVGSVRDSAHCKNLLIKVVFLVAAEEIYGSSLQRSELLLHFLCRPCERRPKNFTAFKTLISETRRSLERVRRYIEELLSTLRSLKTSRKQQTTRWLAFREEHDEDWIQIP